MRVEVPPWEDLLLVPSRHISRYWLFLQPEPPRKTRYRVTLHAPFLRMKQVFLAPEFGSVGGSVARLANAKKDEGNQLYKQQKYTEAIQRYTEAIELCPECAAFYGNRAACHMMQNRYYYALSDAQQAVRLDRGSLKSHLREARCHLALGDLSSARRSLQTSQEQEPTNLSIVAEQKNLDSLQYFICEGEKAYEKEDYRKVVYCMDRALLIAVASNHLKLLKAECLALLSRYQEAQNIANDILQFDNSNVDALYVRGMCLYYQDNVEKALTHFQHLLKLATDHKKARDLYKKAKQLKITKEEGNQAFKSGNLLAAYDCYTKALEIDRHNVFTNAKLYFNRATVCSKINKVNQAIQDCTKAIELDSNYIKAYLRRAKSYLDQEMYDEAIRDYETVYRKEKTKEHKRLLDQAKLDLKKSKRKDYYKILGISKTASDDEIKKAYKKQALIHHPDRHSNATDEKKIEHEKKFKELSEAYNILSDTKKRTRYDNGFDLNDDGLQDIDPNNVFQTFFHGPGMFSSGPGMNGFNFPNGTFSFQFG